MLIIIQTSEAQYKA